MSTINHLTVPEVAHHHVRDGVTAYAVREPGERHWRGHAILNGSCIATEETYASPRVAASHARSLVGEPSRRMRTGNPVEDVIFPDRRRQAR